MGLFWCALNELHWFISYGFNLGDNLRDTGSFRVNVSYRLENLGGGFVEGRWIWSLALLRHLVCEMDIGWGCLSLIRLFLEMSFRVILCGTGTSCSWCRVGFRSGGQLIHGFLKTVGFMYIFII